jgi:3-phosphoshikimate 1-carboxyvinyltransferase
MLRALGAKVTENDDSLIIHGTGGLDGGEADSFGDHRIVMAAALASVLCARDVVIRGAHHVGKSYPGFFSDFKSLGGSVHVL